MLLNAIVNGIFDFYFLTLEYLQEIDTVHVGYGYINKQSIKRHRFNNFDRRLHICKNDDFMTELS